MRRLWLSVRLIHLPITAHYLFQYWFVYAALSNAKNLQSVNWYQCMLRFTPFN
jgi:hypothetical protein